MYRLIALDIDGTLVRPDGSVSEADREAIAHARQSGARVVLCTGRSWQESEEVAEEAGCDRVMVCQGGAALADLDRRCNTRLWEIPRDAALELVGWLEREELALMLFAGSELVVNPRSEETFRSYPSPGFHRCKVVAQEPARFLRERGLPVNKIYAQGDPAIFPPLLERAARCREVTVTSSAPYNFEIVPAGVDKGTGLAALAEELGLTLAETIAIGDSDNDRGMLAAAGMPVAMGNATDAIKAMARYVTDTNENGGVARAIRHFIP